MRNPLLVVQTILAVNTLVGIARRAQVDGKISMPEMMQIIAEGVSPLLALYGVRLDFPEVTGSAQEVREASEVLNGLIELINLQV